MRLIIAAALAVVAALAEFTVAPYLQVGDAVPHPVLVFGVIAALAGGFEVGLACAFVGGVALDILGQRPLGSSAFSLLVAIAVGSLVGGALGRVRIAAPIVATFVASVVYSVLLLVSTTALTTAPITASAMDAVLPSAIYDTILAAIFGPLVLAIVARRREAERVDW
jgi:rod shape-determining protein MreD